MEVTGLLLVVIVLFLIFLFAGFWIAFSLGIVSLIAFSFFLGGREAIFPLLMYNTGTSYTLLAIPLFLFMGDLPSALITVLTLKNGKCQFSQISRTGS